MSRSPECLRSHQIIHISCHYRPTKSTGGGFARIAISTSSLNCSPTKATCVSSRSGPTVGRAPLPRSTPGGASPCVHHGISGAKGSYTCAQARSSRALSSSPTGNVRLPPCLTRRADVPIQTTVPHEVSTTNSYGEIANDPAHRTGTLYGRRIHKSAQKFPSSGRKIDMHSLPISASHQPLRVLGNRPTSPSDAVDPASERLIPFVARLFPDYETGSHHYPTAEHLEDVELGRIDQRMIAVSHPTATDPQEPRAWVLIDLFDEIWK